MDAEKASALILFAESFVGFLLRLALGIFLARHLSEADYGDYSIAIKLLNILVVFAAYGSNIGANRFLAHFLDEGKNHSARRYLTWNIKLLRLTFSLSLVIAIMAFVIMASLHYFDLKDIGDYHIATYTLWLAPIAALAIIMDGFITIRGHARLSNFYESIFKFALQLLLYVVVVYCLNKTIGRLDVIFVVVSSLMVYCFVVFWSVDSEFRLFLIKGIKHSFNKAHIQDNEDEKKWLKVTNQLMITHLVFVTICALDLFAVDLFGQTKAQSGFYAAALTIASVLWLIPDSIYQDILPHLSTWIRQTGSKKQLQMHLNKVNTISFILLTLVTSLLFLTKTYFLLLFGVNYVAASNVISILVIGYAIGCYARIAQLTLIMGGYEKLVTHITFAECLMLIILLIPATYFYGMVGTALVTSGVIIVKALYTIYRCNQLFDLKVHALF